MATAVTLGAPKVETEARRFKIVVVWEAVPNATHYRVTYSTTVYGLMSPMGYEEITESASHVDGTKHVITDLTEATQYGNTTPPHQPNSSSTTSVTLPHACGGH